MNRGDSMTNWTTDKSWADGYGPEVVRILKANAMHLLSIEVASPKEDQSEATDYTIEVRGGTVAVRVRRPNCSYRDLTVRAWRASGAETELAKLRAGFARWYLYAWATGARIIGDWILVDMNMARADGLLVPDKPIRKNPDGLTGFVSYAVTELNACLVAGVVNGRSL